MKKTVVKYLYFLLAGLLFLFVGCDKNDGDPFPGPNDFSRTLFIYMGGNDYDLSRFIDHNMNQIKKAATTVNMKYGRIVIYQARRNDVPRLIMVTPGKNGGVEKELATYPDENKKTADIEVFKAAIERMKEAAPALSYGLVMWSHGSGWLPADTYSPFSSSVSAINDEQFRKEVNSINPHAVYKDGDKWLTLNDFSDALPSDTFDFIIMDECYGAGIEVAWALKDKTKHLILSAAQEDIRGMPYHMIISRLFKENPDLARVCEDYYKYYTTDYPDDPNDKYKNKSATTALINCSELNQDFLDITKNILSQNTSKIKTLDLRKIQYYDHYSAKMFYDFTEYIKAITDVDDAFRAAFIARMNKIVVSKKATSVVFGINIDVEKFCGMSSYIPIDNYSKLNAKYKETAWYQAAYPAGFIP